MSKNAEKKTEAKVEAVAVDVAALMKEHKTKSAVIRYLSGTGMSRSNIAKTLGIRYQHVRNVLLTPLKKK